jgi:FixJ family two-component response regulator
MSLAATTVSVIDDDPAVLKALTRLLGTAGLRVRAYDSPHAFLEDHAAATAGCLVVDVCLPGLNGLELQRELAASGSQPAIVFITGQGDIPTSVRAMKAGAVDFLTKPFEDLALLGAVRSGLQRAAEVCNARDELQGIESRLATLTTRERQVLERVVQGRLNKQIAAELGIVEKTIKVHRARVMAKLGVQSLADLVRLAVRAGIGQRQPAGPAALAQGGR